MSQDIPPIDGRLDPDERELARILRALPAGEPPAALDARILRAAAAAPERARRRGVGLLGGAGAAWGIGSAAAAVLALGIGWHALYGGRALQPVSAPVPVQDAAVDDSVSVEFQDQTSLARKAEATTPAPPPPMAVPGLARAPSRAPAPRAAAARPAPAAAPPSAPVARVQEPFPEGALDEHVAARAEAADAGAVADAAEASRARDAVAGNVAEARRQATNAALSAKQSAPATAPIAAMAASAPATADAGATAGSVAPPARLRPARWLAQVRALRDAGRTVEARARLVEFRRAYPHWVIPTDLAPLLDE